jgi:hypothetical protein
MGPRTSQDAMEKRKIYCPLRESSPSLYRLSYRVPSVTFLSVVHLWFPDVWKIVSFLCSNVSPPEWITSLTILPYTVLAIAIEYKSNVFWYSYLWRFLKFLPEG